MAAGLGSFPFDRPTCLVRSDSRPPPFRHSEFDILRQALTPPPEFSALPPAGSFGASPKAVSGRTSYLRVRLEFLPYPHLIATLFNGCAFGPPLPFKAASAWTRVDHPVSGLHAQTPHPFGMHALFTLGFPPAPALHALTMPAHAARRTVLQKVRGQTPAVLPQFIGAGFQVLFHSPPGVLFTFPSQYSALSVAEGIQPCGVVPASSHKVSRVSWYSGSCRGSSGSAYGAFTLSGRPSQGRSASFRAPFVQS